MEKYIQKINNRIIKKHTVEEVKKVKRNFQISAGIVLGAGLVGFLTCFIIFIVQFLNGAGEGSLTYWLAAIPFLIFIVAGSVVARVADMMPKDAQKIEEEKKKLEERAKEKADLKAERKQEKLEKKEEKENKKNDKIKEPTKTEVKKETSQQAKTSQNKKEKKHS